MVLLVPDFMNSRRIPCMPFGRILARANMHRITDTMVNPGVERTRRIDLNVEILFDDPLFIVAGARS